jgi:hypothetical protein
MQPTIVVVQEDDGSADFGSRNFVYAGRGLSFLDYRRRRGKRRDCLDRAFGFGLRRDFAN